MSRRTLNKPDSLEMLLDTMCNTFGGIILIALLIALLARESRISEAEARVVTESQAMLERRLATAENDLAQTRARQADLERQARESAQSGLFDLVEERERLRQLSAALASLLRQAHERLDSGPAANTGQVEETVRRMLQEVSGLEQRSTEARSLAASLEEERRELQRTLQDDTNRLARALTPSVQQLRPLQEHETTKAHVHVILRYGRLYPLYTFRNGEPERNTTSLRWIEETSARRVEPERDLGVPVATDAALAPFFRQYSPDRMYLVFQVYEDSFATFSVAKAGAIAQGFEYTWQPRKNGEVLRVAASGAPAPPPQ